MNSEQPDPQTKRANNYYYDQMVKKSGKENADKIMRKIAPNGGKKSRGGGFATPKPNKNGLVGSEQARAAGRKSGETRRKK